jgi:hypothetical protein
MKKLVGSRIARHALALALAAMMAGGTAPATERIFGYTYEPETLPKGAWEFEQWVTWRGGRNSAVGQDDYSRWQFREEIEYGLTDNYQLALYLNGQHTSFRDPATGNRESDSLWTGVSIENKYMLLNPADQAVGVALYLEPTISDREFELEQKIIIGQRHGDWKWAVNFVHETEWSLLRAETEGVFEVVAGLSRAIGKRWHVGIEARDHNEIPEYKRWENTAVFLGPVASYHTERWWATLSVLPQVYGKNFQADGDGEPDFDLEGHEKINIRLLFGITF